MRELDPLVSAQPIEQAGPAHIATLKTFDPPLSALDGRRLEGAERRGKNLLFPVDGDDLVLRIHLMSAGRLRFLARARRSRRRRCSAFASRAAPSWCSPRAGRRSAPGSGSSRRRRWSEALAHLGPDALDLDARSLAEILGSERRQLHPLLRDQRAIAGIGRAHANEILLRARLSPFKASTELSEEELERLAEAIQVDLSRALELRERARTTRRCTASTTASASRARSAERPSRAWTTRSTRSTTARTARPAAACSKTAASRDSSAEPWRGRLQRVEPQIR